MVSQSNMYDNIGTPSELDKDFEDIQNQYKSRIAGVGTEAERKLVMRAHKENLIDLALEAELADEYLLKRKLDRVIKSLDIRTFTKGYQKY
jgi:hypothetical protein